MYINTSETFKDRGKLLKFCNWISDSEDLSKYIKDNLIDDLLTGSLIDTSDIKWYILKGLLYDYFDNNNIYIDMFMDHDFKPTITKDCSCHPCVKVNRELAKERYMSRSEAEIKAFVKAFEILK